MARGWLSRLFGAGRSTGAPGARVSARADGASAPAGAPLGPAEWLVVGLGNPGARYAGTRHNAGVDVVERLAAATGARFGHTRHGAHVAEAVVDGHRVVLALPQTFMNRSGDSVVPLLAELGLGPERLLVVTDDLSLPLGQLRLRPRGGSGGHNGLQSITHRLADAAPDPDSDAAADANSAGYPRLRVGIGNSFAPGFQAEFVLARFDADEREAAEAAVRRAADAIRAVVAEGVEAAMADVNRRVR